MVSDGQRRVETLALYRSVRDLMAPERLAQAAARCAPQETERAGSSDSRPRASEAVLMAT